MKAFRPEWLAKWPVIDLFGAKLGFGGPLRGYFIRLSLIYTLLQYYFIKLFIIIVILLIFFIISHYLFVFYIIIIIN